MIAASISVIDNDLPCNFRWIYYPLLDLAMASTTTTMVLCLLSVFPAAVVAFGPSPPNPYNCTKSGCWFSYTNPASLGKPPPNQGRCGEVDAAPRMPPDIWRDQVSVSLYQQLNNSCTR